MIGPDLPIQTATAQPAPLRPAHAPAGGTAPAEAVARFVPAADRAGGAGASEGGYAAAGLRRRMAGRIGGLSDLDTRLSGAAEGLRAAGAEAPAPDAAPESRAPREAELQAAADALTVEIAGARGNLASVSRQMRAELAARMDADSRGAPPPAGLAVEGAAANLTRSGEALIHRATALSARAVLG